MFNVYYQPLQENNLVLLQSFVTEDEAEEAAIRLAMFYGKATYTLQDKRQWHHVYIATRRYEYQIVSDIHHHYWNEDTDIIIPVGQFTEKDN